MNRKDLYKSVIVRIFNLKIKHTFRKKIRNISKNLNLDPIKDDKNLIKAHKTKWMCLMGNIDPLWYRVFKNVSNNPDINFVPEDIYYSIIEPALNNKQFAKAYSDKNFYEKDAFAKLFPKVIYRCINSVYYDSSYQYIRMDEEMHAKLLKDYKEVIVKPATDTGGGKSVELYTKSSNNIWKDSSGNSFGTAEAELKFGTNYIVQEKLSQHKYFEKFNVSSINTVRVFTYRSVKTEKIHILHGLLRIGRPGSHTDNQASGGVSSYIHSSGELNTYAIDKYGKKYLLSDLTGSRDIEIIPYYDKIKNLASSIASEAYYSRVLGFDFAVDANDQIRLIEINNLNNEINFYQMNQGPLFGVFTNEIIDYCKTSQKSFCIDFNYE